MKRAGSVALDSSGRIVLPKPLRSRLNLQPGAELDYRVDGTTILLRPRVVDPSVMRRGGLLVHQGRPERALTDAIENLRQQRHHELGGHT